MRLDFDRDCRKDRHDALVDCLNHVRRQRAIGDGRGGLRSDAGPFSRSRSWRNTIKKNCHTAVPAMTWRWEWDESRSADLRRNEIRARSLAENRNLADKIDEALNKNIIAGIEYQAGFLLSKKMHYMHWSNIVERKPMNGKCYYRIRDSFGSSCQRYNSSRPCKDGYLWVEKQELLNHVDAVTYLE